ncbi:MAG TPA: hypothetical protein VEH31_10225 [Streptosporangiaceae bacterium]|nr:hypothetical protein [Streptosporangiaceae bacterium]
MKKSSARIPCACDRRNPAQPEPSRRGAGSIPALLRIRQVILAQDPRRRQYEKKAGRVIPVAVLTPHQPQP